MQSSTRFGTPGSPFGSGAPSDTATPAMSSSGGMGPIDRPRAPSTSATSGGGTKPPLTRAFTFDAVLDKEWKDPDPRPRAGHGAGGGGMPPVAPFAQRPVADSLLRRQNSFATTLSAQASSPEVPTSSSSSGSAGSSEMEHGAQPAPQQAMSALAVPVGAQASPQGRTQVYVVWDMHSVPLPLFPSVSHCLERVHAVVNAHGLLATFKCVNYTAPAGEQLQQAGSGGAQLPLATKKALTDHGIELEEVFAPPGTKSSSAPGAIDLSVLLALMAAQLQQQQSQSRAQPATLILLSNQEALARALLMLKRSQVFNEIVLIHYSSYGASVGYAPAPLLPLPSDEPEALIRHATVVHEWSSLLKQNLPVGMGPGVVFAPPRIVGPPEGAFTPRRSGMGERHQRAASLKDLPSLLHATNEPPMYNMQQPQQAGRYAPSAFSSQQTSAASSGFVSRASTPTSRDSRSQRSSFSSSSASRSSSMSSAHSMPSELDAGGRSSMGGVLQVPAVLDSNSTEIGDLSVELALQRLHPRARAHMLAFRQVLRYCEQERIIPRESVLKKKICDTSAGDADFESLLQLSVQVGIAAVEGQAPQRIIYPQQVSGLPGEGAVRKFECADFFQPTQRLSVDQTQELLAWLSRHRPEVDRGRFGYAQYLSMHSPPTIRALPHGVLVELVQILLFRKGRVSVNSNLPYADFRSLAALSVASQPHTALLSTVKGPQGQHAAESLRTLYQQIRHDVDRYNEKSSHHPAFTAPMMQAEPAGEDTIMGAQGPSISQFAHVRSDPLPAAVQPTSQPLWRGEDVAAGASTLRAPSSQWQPPKQPSPPSWVDDSAPSAVLGSFSSPGLSAPTQQTHSVPPHQQLTPRFRPPPPFVKTPDVTYGQLFALKLFQSKVGLSHQPLTSAPRFPLGPLIHMDLSALRGGGPNNSGRWSATYSFDVSGTLHTFSACHTYAEAGEAVDTLSQQILQDDLVWQLSWSALMHELRRRRRSVEGVMPSPAMRVLIKSPAELSVLVSEERERNDHISGKVLAQLQSSAVLRLDLLLSDRLLAPMLYSSEEVSIPGPQGTRTFWSVAAQLPAGLIGAQAMTEQPHVSALAENKTSAKEECAARLLACWHAMQAPAVPPPSRPALSASAPAWTPPSESSAPQLTSPQPHTDVDASDERTSSAGSVSSSVPEHTSDEAQD